jgi:hypothetical protein
MRFLTWNLGVGILLILLLSPLLLATLEVRTQVSRLTEGVSWEKTVEYGESFKSLISFIAPLSTARTNAFYDNIDPSMLNHFMGIIALFFGIYGWNSKRTTREWVLIVFGLVIGAMSFSDLPIRKLLFDYVPFMNLFLQGPYLRVFMLLGLAIFIASGLEKWNHQETFSFKKILVPISILVFVLLTIAINWAYFDFWHLLKPWLVSGDWLSDWNQLNLQQLRFYRLPSFYLCEI